MGTVAVCVRRGRDGFEQVLAIKRMHPQLAADPEFREMFTREARLAGSVRHANAVSVVDVDEDEDGVFLIMEYVEGLSLAGIVRGAAKRGAALPMQVVLRVVADVARGLAAAHEATDGAGRSLGIIHRDVSPQNVLVGFDGVARITDFGVAKAAYAATRTATGVLKGKLGYCAPEQLRFEPLDARADLFSLGVVLFEALTGRRLYGGEDGPGRILREPPPDLGVYRDDAPDALSALLFRLLAKEARLRPASASALVAELEEILAGVIAFDGPVDVAEFMRTAFAEERDRLTERLREALASHAHSPAATAPQPAPAPEPADAPSLPATRAAPRRRPPGRVIAWLSAAALLSFAVGAGAMTWLEASDDAPAAAAATPPSEATPADDAEGPVRPSASEVVPAPAPEASSPPAPERVEPVEVEPEAPRPPAAAPIAEDPPRPAGRRRGSPRPRFIDGTPVAAGP